MSRIAPKSEADKPPSIYMLRCPICGRRYSSDREELACPDCRADPFRGEWLRELPLEVPTFPVRLTRRENGSWNKAPLVAKWQERIEFAYTQDWSGADAGGVPMGVLSTLYTIDCDTYKPDYAGGPVLDRWQLPPTMMRRTMSGGTHLIFTLPEDYMGTLRNRVVAKGLETRGNGGYIVWAGGKDGLRYRAGNDLPPAELPLPVCQELSAGSLFAGIAAEGRPWTPPPDGAARAELLAMLRCWVCEVAHPRARLLWTKGLISGSGDTSGSGIDRMMAAYLAMGGFTYDEIVWLLLDQFQWGQIAGPKLTNQEAERQAKRCAAKAVEAARGRHSAAHRAALKRLRVSK